MTTRYLMIQNPGVCPVEGFTVLGVSSSRGNDQCIGQFGSGNKHAVNLLLRNKLPPVVYCGGVKLDFHVKQAIMDDGLDKTAYGRVHCRMSGKSADGKSVKRDQDLRFALEYGALDWDDLAMALREFVSNALDRTVREEGGFKDALKAGRLQVEVVDDMRAKAGYTRVYIELTPDVEKFHHELGKRFLHFSAPDDIDKKILPKSGRNLGASQTAVIYRRGVFVREIAGTDVSLFDYNLDLTMDECRNVSDWSVREAATKALRDSDAQTLEKLFRSLAAGDNTWESNFDRHTIKVDSWQDNDERRDKRQANWKEGWTRAMGSAVVCDRGNAEQVSMVHKKGYRAAAIDADWVEAAEDNNIPVANDYLTPAEKRGQDIIEPSPAAREALDTVWGWIGLCNMTDLATKPDVKCFRTIVDAASVLSGYYDDNVIYLSDMAATAVTDSLLQTVLEECAHHITRSNDGSRDLQSWAFQFGINRCTLGQRNR